MRSAARLLALTTLLGAIAISAAISESHRGGGPDRVEAAGPQALRALAPDIVDFIVDGDQGPNAAVPGVGLIQPLDGLNFVEVMVPGDQSALLGGNMDMYPDAAETNLLEALGKSDIPPGPPQMGITAGQQSTVGLAGKLTIAAYMSRPTTHGGTYTGDAETGEITFSASQSGFVFHEAVLAQAAPHLMGPVDPTLASVKCGSFFSWTVGSDPFTGAGKADFADGDCDGVIHGPFSLGQPQAAIGSCLLNYIIGPLIPNDPTCREDGLVLVHIMAASPSTPLGVTNVIATQAPAPYADLSGIGAPTTGGMRSAPIEVVPDAVALAAIRNPDCNDNAPLTCIADPMVTGNAAPNDCEPQPNLDGSTGAAVLTWDQVDDTDPALATAFYAPVTDTGRPVLRYRVTWDSDNDNIVHPQESSIVTINVPVALPYPTEGVINGNLLCTGSTAGVANITLTSGAMTATFPVSVVDLVSLRLDMDITNGNGVCDPIDSLRLTATGAAPFKVGVCLTNPLGQIPVAALQYNITYNDTVVAAPEVADVAPALDDNPDANVGATTFTSATHPNDLGGGWACDGGVGAFPVGDIEPLTGAGNGRAFSGGCGSFAGPNALIAGPLGVVTFNVLAAGIDTLALAGAAVTADDTSEIGSCNPVLTVEMVCGGGTLIVLDCPAVPNSDPEIRTNGANLPGDDETWPNHDTTGDVCDTDDDNDGLVDLDEVSGTSCGGVPTSPVDPDTDDDHLMDGWECNPWNSMTPSDPTDPQDRQLGGSSSLDTDGDGIFDLWERRGYNSSVTSTDSDGDGCDDRIESVSVNANRAMEDSDRIAVAKRAFDIAPYDDALATADQDTAFDINKNGFVDDTDRIFAARGSLLPEVQPKMCT